MKLFADNRAMSLPEMMIGVAVLIILLGMISMFIIRAFYVNSYSIEQGLNTSVLQNTLRSFTTNLREAKQSDAGGYTLELADDFEIIFYANIDDDDVTERLRYYLDGTQLKLGVTEPTGFPLSYPSGDDETRVIGNGIVNTAGQPLFYYFNQDYPEDVANNPLATPATVSDVTMIKVDVYANVDPDEAPDSMHMETFVRPRNIGD